MKIGILQAGYVPEPLVEKYGQYPEMFQRLLAGHGFEFQTYVVAAGEFPESVQACDGWLITGSADGAYESHAYIPPLENLIREIYAAEIPLAGICFGHQIMAQALGGKVAKHAAGWSIGQTRYQLGTDKIDCLAMHQDQVVTKPAAAEVIASSAFCANAGFAYPGSHGVKAMSFQFHPEFSPEYTRDSIAIKAGNALTEEQAAAAITTVREQNDSARIGQQLAEFFLTAKPAEH
ncbi:type 1 glutamine amidotransferase [Bremerella cremea]|uniref:Type 1 glutamine amidotransferase n=1 Tax=Bremerella cremea TaxID=1031537 RepID=A0A368KU96_9BACT|nr:type 1 glutamine amidotransferase [Bremerella cremea]RCS53978.1 type 1 glutamine amidotransferase [Bremerella cremea]